MLYKDSDRINYIKYDEHGPGAAKGAPGKQIGRDAHQRRAAKADELALGEVKGDFGFDFG